jgi:hypothetical protein
MSYPVLIHSLAYVGYAWILVGAARSRSFFGFFITSMALIALISTRPFIAFGAGLAAGAYCGLFGLIQLAEMILFRGSTDFNVPSDEDETVLSRNS